MKNTRKKTKSIQSEVSQVVASVKDLRFLMQRVLMILDRHLQLDSGYFVAISNDNYLTSDLDKNLNMPKSDVFEIADYLKIHRQVFSVSKLPKAYDQLRKLLLSYKVDVVFPIFHGGKLSGFIAVGRQKTPISIRKISGLKDIGGELAIAVDYGFAMKTIHSLNKNLQQKIDNATSEIQKNNRQLQKLDDAKDEFLSMASHQLRTPLTSIKGYIDMVLDGDAGKINQTQRQYLTEAFRSSERMVNLISDFLNVSRLQTGKFSIDKTEVDLVDLVESEVATLETAANLRGIDLVFYKPKKAILIKIDETKFQQVVMNFVDNALYYTPEGGRVEVILEDRVNEVVCLVKDTGMGVPKKEQENLFKKFFRATNARRQRPDGTGVGLYLAKTVVAGHGGEIIFESEEGKGSTFGFRLPKNN